MNNNTLSQMFLRVGYKLIHIRIYVQSIEKIAECMKKDKQDIEKLYQLIFYNGLSTEMRQ